MIYRIAPVSIQDPETLEVTYSSFIVYNLVTKADVATFDTYAKAKDYINSLSK